MTTKNKHDFNANFGVSVFIVGRVYLKDGELCLSRTQSDRNLCLSHS